MCKSTCSALYLARPGEDLAYRQMPQAKIVFIYQYLVFYIDTLYVV